QTGKVVSGERAFLCRLEGGCQVPIAAHGKIENKIFTLSGLVATTDGKVIIKDIMSGPVDRAESIGIQLAESLISMGAKKILEELKNNL
ncbi:MAG: hydroxymethylbilane synthase, partial [Thermodesulfobacteriota bacterium]|nr:hydroxymethylbilane synthase [Thermodesulfobacteriota bacterium]